MIVLVLLIIVVYVGYLFLSTTNKDVGKGLENPMKKVINKEKVRVNGSISNPLVNDSIIYNETKVIEEGIVNFNEDYINYLLVAIGVGNLHSAVGFGNPVIEFSIDSDSWGSEMAEGILNTQGGTIEEEDLRIFISKEEAVKALISSDAKQFMKDSVNNGGTRIEMVAGKPTLFAKGYLAMYKEITGKELED